MIRRLSVLAAAIVTLLIACQEVETPADPGPAVADTETAMKSQTSLVGYKAIDLGTIGEGHYFEESVATQVNEVGQILVVTTRDLGAGYPHRSFIWHDGAVTDLGLVPSNLSFDFNLALDINEAGQVVGVVGTLEGLRAYLWEAGVLTNLGALPGGTSSVAFDLDDAGEVVVGMSSNVANEQRAVRWDNGVIENLGTLGGSRSYARLLNERGQIAGASETADGERHAFLWDDGTMIDLGTIAGGVSEATGINDSGDVIGNSTGQSSAWHAFLWRGGTMIDLGPGRALAINEAGQVLMTAFTDSGIGVWTDGTLVDVGHLGGGHSGAGHGGYFALNTGLNEHGWVAGGSHDSEGSVRAFLWDGVIRGFETLGGRYGHAFDVNDTGYVVGESDLPSGIPHATLWRPVTVDEAVQDLVDGVASLEDLGTITQGQAHALTNHLTIAAAMIEDGKTTPAANKLQAFINQVEGLISGLDPVISPEEGQPLIDAASGLLSSTTG